METGDKRPDIQESADENLRSYRGKGPVGSCHRVRDPRVCGLICHRGRPRCHNCSLIGRKPASYMFSDEETCCTIPSLDPGSSFFPPYTVPLPFTPCLGRYTCTHSCVWSFLLLLYHGIRRLLLMLPVAFIPCSRNRLPSPVLLAP